MADIDFILDSTNINSWVTKIDKIPVTDRKPNFEPILTSVKMEVKQSLTFTPAIDDILRIDVDSTPQYQGRVVRVKTKPQTRTLELEIEHGLMEMTRKKLDFPTLDLTMFNLSADWASLRTISSYGDQLDDDLGTVGSYQFATPHGFSSSTFTPITLRANSSSDPVVNSGQRYFYALALLDTVPDANTFLLFTRPIKSLSFIVEESSYNGYQTTVDYDKDVYNPLDNQSAPNISLKTVFDAIAGILGVTFDYTDIASYNVYSTYTWDKLVLDVNMLYALNQSAAIFHTAIDEQGNEGSKETNYRERRLTFFDFFSYIMSCLGFSLHLKSANTWEILKPSNTQYSFSPKEYYKKSEYTVEGEPNTAYGAESFSGTRSDYADTVEDALDKGYKMDATLAGVINNVNNVEYISNLLFFLRSGTGDVLAPNHTTNTNYFRIDQATSYRQNAIQNNYNVKEVTSPIKDSIYTIKKHFMTVDLSKGKLSNIEQDDLV